jgi:hypothetical protein
MTGRKIMLIIYKKEFHTVAMKVQKAIYGSDLWDTIISGTQAPRLQRTTIVADLIASFTYASAPDQLG